MDMSTFMLSVLVSNVFWVCYGLLSVVITVCLLRWWSQVALLYLTNKPEEAHDLARRNGSDIDCLGAAIALASLHMVIWPIYAAFFGIVGFFWCLGQALKYIYLGMFTAIDKIVPNVSVKIKKKEE